MQQLTIEHKKPLTTNKKVVEKKEFEELVENKREGHGRNIALTRKVLRLENSDTFYVESESIDNLYYFVRYNFSGTKRCSCPDNSIRGQKCKHQFTIEYSILKGTLKDIEKLPLGAKRYPTIVTKDDWRNEEYDF